IVSANTYNTVLTADGVLDHVVQLTAGRSFFCARRQGNDVWCWGDYNGYGRRGVQAGLSVRNAFATKIADGASTIATGYAYTCTVINGTLACGGLQQGNGTATGNWTASNVATASVSGGGGYALLTDGTGLSFGL